LRPSANQEKIGRDNNVGKMPKWFWLVLPCVSLPQLHRIYEMHSLYDILLAQHGRQLMPVRCAYSTVTQLHRYFEEVVLENNLNALVIESLPLSPKRSSREKA